MRTEGWSKSRSSGPRQYRRGGLPYLSFEITVDVPRYRWPRVSRTRQPITDGGGSKISHGVSRRTKSACWRHPHPVGVFREWSYTRSPRYLRPSRGSVVLLLPFLLSHVEVGPSRYPSTVVGCFRRHTRHESFRYLYPDGPRNPRVGGGGSSVLSLSFF